MQFINCVKFNFGRSYLPSDSQTNTAIWLLYLPFKLVSKTVIRPIQFPIGSSAKEMVQGPIYPVMGIGGNTISPLWGNFYQVLAEMKLLVSLFSSCIVSAWKLLERWLGLDHFIVRITFLMVNTHIEFLVLDLIFRKFIFQFTFSVEKVKLI